MAYGLTPNGFIIKRLIDIQEERKEAYRSKFGEGINLDDNSVFGQQIGIESEREALLWELALALYNSQYPDTAEGISLDNCGAIVAVPRLDPTESLAVIRARGSAGTVIAKGRIVSVKGNSSIRFVTDVERIIASPVNAKQKILFSLEPDAGTWTLTFKGETTAPLNYDANAENIESALESLDSITDVNVSGNYSEGFLIEFINEDSEIQQPSFTVDSSLTTGAEQIDIEVEMIDEGGAYVDIPVTAEEKGAYQAPSMSLTEIETPVSGWDEAYNLEDAKVGRGFEEDEEYRPRRNISLQQSRSGTVEAIRNTLKQLENVVDVIVFENDDSVPDSDGRPPKSFEAVVDGGDDETIANTIWQSKPAGIKPFGTEIFVVTDSQGLSKQIGFSRPTTVMIYLNITVVKEEGGEVTETQVKDAVIAYGEALKLGDDIIVYPDFIASLSGLAIKDVELDIGKTPTPSGDDNIVIAPNERAEFDRANISVTIL